MNKKIIVALGTALALVGGVVAMSAFEAHIINVTAHIENALAVDTEALDFGTVFPQEALTKNFQVKLSDSFLGQKRICEVYYEINQKPKCIVNGSNPVQHVPCVPTVGTAPTCECPNGTTAMLSLCPFLSKLADNTPIDNADDNPEAGNDESAPSYYTPGGCITPGEASGELEANESDIVDTWTVDLKVPPFEGYVAQDWPANCPTLSGTGVNQDGTDLGCDLWVEVTGFEECEKTIQVTSSMMNFSSTGWAGWSCPSEYPNIVTGTTDCALPLTYSLAWQTGASVDGHLFPTTPWGYIYGANEEGWIVQNGGDGQSCHIILTCQAD